MTDRIEVNPAVMLGKPVIRGTRVPVELILRKLSEGATEADLLEAYPRLTRCVLFSGLKPTAIVPTYLVAMDVQPMDDGTGRRLVRKRPRI